jgi:hypothetical protein
MSWFWKEIYDKDSAENAVQMAVGVSYFVAGITTLLAVLSLFSGHPIMEVNGWSLLDAALFAVIGWRITKLSLPWTIVGTLLYLLETVVSLASRGSGVGVLTIVFIIAYVNALRGVFAYRRYDREQAPATAGV